MTDLNLRMIMSCVKTVNPNMAIQTEKVCKKLKMTIIQY